MEFADTISTDEQSLHSYYLLGGQADQQENQ